MTISLVLLVFVLFLCLFVGGGRVFFFWGGVFLKRGRTINMPYPLKVPVCPPRHRRPATRSKVSGQVGAGQVRSGQVRSECLTCTFRASCCSARLRRFLSVRDRVSTTVKTNDIHVRLYNYRGE